MVLTLEAPSRPVHSRPRVFHKVLSAQVLALLVAAVALRVWHLANVPGVNGDEAWYGARVMQVLHGEPIPWRTPTGNPINVFYFVPLLLLHAVFHPSFLLLRSVAVASGLAAIVANYFLCQRVFGKTTAVTAAILTAVLPINIAYSRFGWDACQSVLACTLVVYLALFCAAEPTRGCWRLALLLALISSIVVHPTNLLLAPIALVSLGYAYRDDLRHRLASALSRKHALLSGLLLLALAGAGAFVFSSRLAGIFARVTAPGEAAVMLVLYLRLLSGSTVYRFVSGAIPNGDFRSPWMDFDLFDGLSAAAIVLALLGFCGQLKRPRPCGADVCLAFGWAASGLAFFLFAGPGALAPHFERYGLCLVVPATLALARGVSWWRQRRPTVAASLAIATAWLLLGNFCWQYFGVIQRTGGQSHPTFRTADVEPKQQALAHILRRRGAQAPTWIVTEEWWNEWPLRYLAADQADVRVVKWSELPGRLKDAAHFTNRQIWFVEFAGSSRSVELLRRLERLGLAARKTQIEDYGHNALLSVFEPRQNAGEK